MPGPRRPTKTERWRDEQGFTLPELLVTIVILGILLAIASSTWFSVVESRRVTAAANQLAADMRLAHANATNQLASWRVVLVPNRGASGAGPDYYLVKLDAAGAVASGATVSRSLPDSTRVVQGDPLLNDSGLETLYASLPLGGAATRSLEFDPDGSMDNLAPTGVTGRDRIRVTEDGSPEGVLEFVEETSRIKVVG